MLELNAVETRHEGRGTSHSVRRSKRNMSGGYRQTRRTCPKCGDAVLRVHRRIIDHIYSLYRPVYRYQCTSLECAWRGNLPPRAMLNQDGLAPLTTPTGTG